MCCATWFRGQPATPVALAPDSFGGPSPGGLTDRDIEAGSVKSRSGSRISSQIRTCTNGTNVIMFDWLHFYFIFNFESAGFCVYFYFCFLFVFMIFPCCPLIIVVGGRSCHRGE